MRLPPDLLAANLSIQTSAAPNTNVTVTVRASPGANFRLRVWSIGISYDSTAGVMVQKFRGIWVNNAATFWMQYMAAEAGGGLFSITDHFDGGLAMVPNTAVQFTHADSVASLFWRVQMSYTIEATA